VSLTKRDEDGQQQTALNKNFANVRQIVCENRRLTIRSIAEQVNMKEKQLRKS